MVLEYFLKAKGVLAAMAMACLLVPVASGETAEQHAAPDPDEPAQRASPWLLTPLLSVDPKLGTNLGGLAAYLHRFDESSPVSMAGLAATYSNTDSLVGALFGDLYWGKDHHRLVTGLVYGDINNEYDDFLGTGRPVETVDQLQSIFLRYQYRIWHNWFLGAQFVRTNYAIDFPPAQTLLDQQIGYMGFDSTGLGLVLAWDTRNDVRNPDRGSYFLLDTVHYQGGEGGSGTPDQDGILDNLLQDDSVLNRDGEFDVLRAAYTLYSPLGQWFKGVGIPETVLAVRASGRWTKDAPVSGFSSVLVPGYTRGNYLGENYVDLQFDLRVPISKRWGWVLFGGVGCLHGNALAGEEASSGCGSNTFPGLGTGISWLIKPESGVVVRAEVAKGTGDNSPVYLRFGHPF